MNVTFHADPHAFRGLKEQGSRPQNVLVTWLFFIYFYVRDVKLFLSSIFDKYNNSHKGRSGPSVLGYAEAVCGVLCYERWLKNNNPVGEVLSAESHIAKTLKKVVDRFPRRAETDG